MKNIELYYKINIFLSLYYNRTKLDDLGGFLSCADILIFDAKQPDFPIRKLTQIVDICIWNDWLKVIGFRELIPKEGTWSNIDIELYIKNTGNLEVDENLQFSFMIEFLKSQEFEFKFEWRQLFEDIENNTITKMEWVRSQKILDEFLRFE